MRAEAAELGDWENGLWVQLKKFVGRPGTTMQMAQQLEQNSAAVRVSHMQGLQAYCLCSSGQQLNLMHV